MEESALIVVAAAIFVWGVVSARLERADLTAPIVFVAVGVALAGLGPVHAASAPEASSRWWRSPSCGCSSPMPPGSASTTSATTSAESSAARLRPAADRPGRLGAGAVAVPGARPLARPARRRGSGADRRGAGRPGRDQPGGAVAGTSADHRGERTQRRDRHPGRHARDRRRGRGGEGLGSRPGSAAAWSSWRRRGRRRRRRRRRRVAAAVGPAARDGPPRTSPAIAVLALALLAYAGGARRRRQRLRRRVLRRAGLRRRAPARGARRAGLPRAVGRAWSPCWCGWPSAPSPSRSCSTASTCDRAVRRAQPHRGADGPGRAGPDRRRARPRHGAVRRAGSARAGWRPWSSPCSRSRRSDRRRTRRWPSSR